MKLKSFERIQNWMKKIPHVLLRVLSINCRQNDANDSKENGGSENECSKNG
jgi:hypothetical protein